ncbi:MAG: hypothetical protein ACKV2Q_23100, partial [Planctomycetaceae bacterium]
DNSENTTFDDEEDDEISIDTTLIHALINDPDVRIKRPSPIDENDEGQSDAEQDDDDETDREMNDIDNDDPDERHMERTSDANLATPPSPAQQQSDDDDVRDSDSETTTTTTSSSSAATTMNIVPDVESPVVVELDDAMRQILVKKLQYKPTEVDQLIPEVAQIIVRNNLFRPPEGIPSHWLLSQQPQSQDVSSSLFLRSKYLQLIRRILIQRIIPTALLCIVAITVGPSISHVSTMMKTPQRGTKKQIQRALVPSTPSILNSTATDTTFTATTSALSCQDVADHSAMHVGQTIVTALIPKRQTFVIQPQQV